MDNCFVGLGENADGKIQKIKVFTRNGTAAAGFKYKPFRQVLWGDWLTLAPAAEQADAEDGWTKIIWGAKGKNPTPAYIKSEFTAKTRPLEIVFVDVGQGDGAVLITPERDGDEAVIVVDAGESRNMYEFLSHRFGGYGTRFQFHAAIITHPDKDHYLGFQDIFDAHNMGFDIVYQNGLVERAAGKTYEKLGGLSDDVTLGRPVLKKLALGRSEIEGAFSDPSNFGKTKFPPVMHAALNNPNVADFKMLSTEHSTSEGGRNYLPGFAPGDGRGYDIEVLGPVVETGDGGAPVLRKIGGYGKTKNGHSILLRLNIGGFKVFFGGDLNKPAEKFLLAHYGGGKFFSRPTASSSSTRKAKYDTMITTARDWIGADVMKVCHHGAEDVTDEFMEAVHPATFVISSGDDENYVHPRPDLLGRLGKAGRGEAPVLLSTELQRGSRADEDYKIGRDLMDKLMGLTKKPTAKQLENMTAKITELSRSNITVYGSIYLKTDGKDMLVAFKKETGSKVDKWFWFHYKVQADGSLLGV